VAEQILNAAEIAEAKAAFRAAEQNVIKANAAKTLFGEQNKPAIIGGITDLTKSISQYTEALKSGATGKDLKTATTGVKSALATSKETTSTLNPQLQILESNIKTATDILAGINIPAPVYGQDNSELLKLIESLQSQIAAMQASMLAMQQQTEADATAAAEQKALDERQSAFDILYEQMDSLGLAALVEPLRNLIQENVSPSEFAVKLRQSDAYKARFIANEERLKKGLRVLQPREYIAVEDSYRQVLRSYGLQQFDNDTYVQQFIANDVSAAELSDRVSMAVQRVQNADPAIARTLRDYYGIGQTDLVAYVLDPNQQLQKIQRQVAAAEIGSAARLQGLEAGVGVAEQLAAQGITQAEAQRGYATIADILPTAEKLSQIYGASLEGYDLAQAEQEVFNQLASAQRRRERLTQREIAAFSGQSGLGRTSLTQDTGGQI
jgi:hypothetical protein